MLDCIVPTVSKAMNSILDAPVSHIDVKTALFDMSPNKSPGPDGMSVLFYQKYWHIIVDDMTKAILNILNEGAPLDDWNKTIITLIPKV